MGERRSVAPAMLVGITLTASNYVSGVFTIELAALCVVLCGVAIWIAGRMIE